MTFHKKKTVLYFLLACCIGLANATPPSSAEGKSDKPAAQEQKPIDRSGEPRKGKASYYGKQFHGKKMADGTPMDPDSNVAASRTLPLGTKAEVTNLENGKSEVVEIRDRGPYVEGRIVDVTPKVAEKLDMKEDGVAPVEVRPIEIPPADSNGRQALNDR
ncbi:MAG TPA: septal ring lytic transglycosylase RlpA family protein [Noviherbaspirillum sp.]